MYADGISGSADAFNNEAGGTFTQQGTGTTYFTTSNTGVSFNNAGTVAVNNGVLDLEFRGHGHGDVYNGRRCRAGA